MYLAFTYFVSLYISTLDTYIQSQIDMALRVLPPSVVSVLQTAARMAHQAGPLADMDYDDCLNAMVSEEYIYIYVYIMLTY